jgi:predicted short-subunit dehydrogenase-like oxidoreductase (DUF2520 family)
MDSDTKRIVCVGSGGVASSLLPALYGAGYKIVQVCSRNLTTAQALAKVVGASANDKPADTDPNADIYIIAVPDSEIENVLRDTAFGGGLVVHTSGSTPISVFEKYEVERCGVLYPLQTFSRQRGVNFARVPLYVEGRSQLDAMDILFMARKLSAEVAQVNSEERMLLHVAAVYACNFTNHMLTVASRLTAAAGLSFAALKPLIQETISKALAVENPALVQTGPAARGDANIVQKHIEALAKHPLQQQIYRLISESVMRSEQYM